MDKNEIKKSLADIIAEVAVGDKERAKSLLLHHVRELGGGSNRPDSVTARILYAFDWVVDDHEQDVDNLLAETLNVAVGTVRQVLGQQRKGWNGNQPVRRDLSDLEDFE